MALKRDEFEKQFNQYREFLCNEIYRFNNTLSIYKQINQIKLNSIETYNRAPAFFSNVEYALFTTIVLWADKIFDEHGECGLYNFLAFIENNRKWMSINELKRRKSFPDDHWVLQDRAPITFKSINTDREKLQSLTSLKSFKTLRDKFHAHFDKGYAFDQAKLLEEAPILWSDLDEISRVMGTMLNNYSSDFDSNVYAWETINIDDLDNLLAKTSRGRRRPSA